MRQENSHEGAFLAKQKGKAQGGEKKQSGEKKDKEKNEGQRNKSGGKKSYPPCPHCKRKSHSKNYCWFCPGVQCRSCKQFGHVERVCRNINDRQGQQAQVTEHQQQHETEELFVATCYATSGYTDTWLLDSGCT